MPRCPVELTERLERLSILDAQGGVDSALDPHLPVNDLLKLYRAMLLSRRWEEKMEILVRQGKIGVYPPFRGQEAASLGPAFVMESCDWLVPSFREMPAMLYRGWPMVRLFLGWWGGHEFGAQPPAGINILPLCGPVAAQCPSAAGIAMGLKLRGDPGVVICFVGDGGTSEGDFHETMNVAGVFRLPLIMIVQNNQWAISTPRSRQTASQTFAQKALAYGFDGLQIDGNDILAMICGTREAVTKARSGGGPTLIEAVTYRLGPHSTADNPRKYRSAEEEQEWELRDPLTRFTRYLDARGILTADLLGGMETDIHDEILAAATEAEAYQSDVRDPFRYCFSEMPGHLLAQGREFDAYLSSIGHPQAARPRELESFQDEIGPPRDSRDTGTSPRPTPAPHGHPFRIDVEEIPVVAP